MYDGQHSHVPTTRTGGEWDDVTPWDNRDDHRDDGMRYEMLEGFSHESSRPHMVELHRTRRAFQDAERWHAKVLDLAGCWVFSVAFSVGPCFDSQELVFDCLGLVQPHCLGCWFLGMLVS